jgi:c-di-GMP-binding flagellar brake protein YcgR
MEEEIPVLTAVNAERREHPRFPIRLRIEYRRLKGSRCHFGQLLDISESGLLLNLSEGTEVGQNLRLKIFVSSGFSKIIEAVVRVVWRQFKKGAGYRIGARFIDLPPEQMEKVRILLHHLMKPKPGRDSKVSVFPLDPPKPLETE